MFRRFLVRVGVPLTAALVLAAGCGADGVAPTTWARHVCQALKPWTTTISDLTRRTQQQMTQLTTPQQVKDGIVKLLSAEEQASERARKRIVAAGVPGVDHGKSIAAQFTAALASARDAYGTARRAVQKLSTADPNAFYTGVGAAIRQLNKQYDAGSLDTSKVRSEDLQKAFDEVPECQ